MKLYLKSLLLLLPIAIFIIAINFFVDHANIFHNGYEKGIAEHLVKGYNVTNVENYNERLLQKYFIDNMKDCPDIIALGSSRIMQLNSPFQKEDKFINSGVSGASLEDDIAIYYLYEKRGCKIKKVMLGIDPWLLNDNHTQTGWKELRNEYAFFLNNQLKQNINLGAKTKAYDYLKYKELLSRSYFKSSLQFIQRGSDKTYYPTKNTVNKGFTRVADGSIYYGEAFRMVSPDDIEKRALINIEANPVYRLGDFTTLSGSYKTTFTKFIDYLQKKNIEVEFFLSPYHPIVYEFFKENKYYHIVFKCEDYFKQFAAVHKIKVIGSYDPSKYELDNLYLLDGLHCNEKAIKKIFEISNYH